MQMWQSTLLTAYACPEPPSWNRQAGLLPAGKLSTSIADVGSAGRHRDKTHAAASTGVGRVRARRRMVRLGPQLSTDSITHVTVPVTVPPVLMPQPAVRMESMESEGSGPGAAQPASFPTLDEKATGAAPGKGKPRHGEERWIALHSFAPFSYDTLSSYA
jgi:hypothetical protein